LRVLFFTKINKFDRLNCQDITLLCQPMNKRGVLPLQSTLIYSISGKGVRRDLLCGRIFFVHGYADSYIWIYDQYY
jgi:hypothetical protein